MVVVITHNYIIGYLTLFIKDSQYYTLNWLGSVLKGKSQTESLMYPLNWSPGQTSGVRILWRSCILQATPKGKKANLSSVRNISTIRKFVHK